MSDDIRPIRAEQTHAVRMTVLRPGLALSESCFPDDDAPDALHLGATLDNEVVGTASFFREDHPALSQTGLYRLRGMAVLPERQKRGLGDSLLSTGLKTLGKRAVPLLWCNARKTAVEFYRNRGFEVVGEAFDIPGIGPHFLMTKTVQN